MLNPSFPEVLLGVELALLGVVAMDSVVPVVALIMGLSAVGAGSSVGAEGGGRASKTVESPNTAVTTSPIDVVGVTASRGARTSDTGVACAYASALNADAANMSLAMTSVVAVIVASILDKVLMRGRGCTGIVRGFQQRRQDLLGYESSTTVKVVVTKGVTSWRGLYASNGEFGPYGIVNADYEVRKHRSLKQYPLSS
jgi:hypothetical protein